MVDGFASVFKPEVFVFLLAGIPLGLIFGIIPGLGGIVALAILLPVVYGMEPIQGLTLLLATHAVVYTGGSISAVLLNIPGATPNAATVIDGFPMTQKGEGGRAIGAALASSGLGGVFGALVLVALIPAVRPVVLAFGAPETFFLALLGISFIAVLGKGSILKGLIAGGLGLLIALFGFNPMTGEARFSFGTIYLLDGFRLIPLCLGLFAIPEVIELAARGGTIAKVQRMGLEIRGDIIKGVKDTFHHWWLLLRCSAIGAGVGIVPGVGGETAPFVAYGHAKQTSKHPERFGQGYIEGVIAPESANNAKEGGSLVPTLAFGVPGSSGMAVLLGGFMILGIEPGPLFLQEHLDLAFSLVATIAVANVLAVLIALSLSGQLARVAFIPGHILGPVVLVFCVVGAYCTQGNMLDVVWTLVFGALGYLMKVFDYNRPVLLLAFVLGGIAERQFNIAIGAYGALFFLRPISLALLIVIILGLSSGWLRNLPFLRRGRA